MTMRKITITLGLIAALFALSVAGVAQARNGADDGTATELRHGADDPVGDDRGSGGHGADDAIGSHRTSRSAKRNRSCKRARSRRARHARRGADDRRGGTRRCRRAHHHPAGHR
jgi:hypothetical protein